MKILSLPSLPGVINKPLLVQVTLPCCVSINQDLFMVRKVKQLYSKSKMSRCYGRRIPDIITYYYEGSGVNDSFDSGKDFC